MRYFGHPWNAEIAAGVSYPVPVGVACTHCEELFADGDQGVFIRRGRLDVEIADVSFSHIPLHLDCFLRMIVGSVGHLRQRCPCFGGNEEDPPGLTKRQAAAAAVRLFEKLKGIAQEEEKPDDDDGDEDDTVLEAQS